MKFENEMKKYKNLSPEDRQTKVINILKIIKDKNEKLLKTYNLLVENKNLPSKMIDDIYKILLELTIYQQWLSQRESNLKINAINNSLLSHLEEEKLEREKEAMEAEKLLDF